MNAFCWSEIEHMTRLPFCSAISRAGTYGLRTSDIVLEISGLAKDTRC